MTLFIVTIEEDALTMTDIGSSDFLSAYQDVRVSGNRIVIYRVSKSTATYVSTWSINVDMLPSHMYIYDDTYISIIGRNTAGDKLRFVRVSLHGIIFVGQCCQFWNKLIPLRSEQKGSGRTRSVDQIHCPRPACNEFRRSLLSYRTP